MSWIRSNDWKDYKDRKILRLRKGPISAAHIWTLLIVNTIIRNSISKSLTVEIARRGFLLGMARTMGHGNRRSLPFNGSSEYSSEWFDRLWPNLLDFVVRSGLLEYEDVEGTDDRYVKVTPLGYAYRNWIRQLTDGAEFLALWRARQERILQEKIKKRNERIKKEKKRNEELDDSEDETLGDILDSLD